MPRLADMEVHFTPAEQTWLNRLAERTSKEAEAVVHDPVTRAIEDDAPFVEAVERGIASLDRGEYMTHEEVGARLARLSLEASP